MKTYRERPSRKTIRLKEWDYSTSGAYFVTICAYKKECIFEDTVLVSIIKEQWQRLPNKFSCIELDEFVMMPNHIHCILWINNVGATLAVAQDKRAGASPAPTLGNIVGAFKSIVSNEYLKWIKQNSLERPGVLWQRNYYEHIIRNEEELNRIRHYIQENPLKWDDDPENPKNIFSEEINNSEVFSYET